MSDSEKLLKKLGATKIEASKHVIYMIDNVRFTLHRGDKPNHREFTKVKMTLRNLGY
jgi:hypothetical protein